MFVFSTMKKSATPGPFCILGTGTGTACSGCSTAVEQTPRNKDVTGWLPQGFYLFSFFLTLFLFLDQLTKSLEEVQHYIFSKIKALLCSLQQTKLNVRRVSKNSSDTAVSYCVGQTLLMLCSNAPFHKLGLQLTTRRQWHCPTNEHPTSLSQLVTF